MSVSIDGQDGAAQRHKLAEKIQSDHRRHAQKVQIITISIVIAGVLATVGAMLWFRSLPSTDSAQVIAPQSATGDFGFVVTRDGAPVDEDVELAGLTRIDVYEDYLCSTCRVFHERTGAFLAEEVQSGTTALVYHPLAFLKNEAGDDYSVRAANAAACVADVAGPNAYVVMHNLLLTNQPAYDQPGLTDERLTALAAEAGAADVADCVAERTFAPWVEAATQAALRADVHETPTVRVDGTNVVKSDDGVVTIPGEAEIRFAMEALK